MNQSATTKKETHILISAVAIPIFLAIATAVIGFAINIVIENRTQRLAYVNSQIERLYGPLFAYSSANRTTWARFVKKKFNRKDVFEGGLKAESVEDVTVWRQWMRSVFFPLNLKMEETLVQNAQYIDGERMYPIFTDFFAHVESYKAVLANWKDSDDLNLEVNRTVNTNLSLLNYPQKFDDCIDARYQHALKIRAALRKSWTGWISHPRTNFDPSCS